MGLMARAALAGLLVLLFPLAAFAQSNPSLTAYARGVDDGVPAEESARLHITAMSIDAHVHGLTADVTMELELSTISTIADEVRLALNMPADAVVTGYALDVAGKMIPGQLLDQPKARNVYQDEVRKGIDPGLAEVTEGNQFQTRIFPVTPGNPRRFRVSFSAPFDPSKGFVLPLISADAVGSLALSVKVEGYAAAPDLRFGGKAIGLRKEGGGWIASLAATSLRLTDSLTIAGGTPAAKLLVSQHGNGRQFFQLSDSGSTDSAGSAKGGRLRVYWDRSLSRRDDLLDKEADLLAALVQRMEPAAIDLVSFASDRPQVATLSDAGALKAALGAITYRGGTSFAGLDALPLADADQCLMFGDGQITIDHAAQFSPDCRLSIISSAAEANGARLGRMAQASRGAFHRLTADNGAALADRLAHPAVAVVSVRDDSGQRLGFRALPAPAGGWRLVGEMPDGSDVHLRIAGLRKGLTDRTYANETAAVVRADAPGALWAAQRVGELGDDPIGHDRMVAFARRFHVAGPAMAFLVLESQSQYIQADIPPPPGFDDDWLADYRRMKADHGKSHSDALNERFAFVLEQWNDRKSWWNTRFVTVRHPKKLPDPVMARAEMASAPPPMLAMPAPPPPPPAPASASAPAQVARPSAQTGGSGGDDSMDDIIVTGAAVANASVQEVASSVTMMGRDEDGKAIALDVAEILSDQPYMTALTAAAPAERLKVLRAEELKFGTLPAFYIDTAEWFHTKGDAATSELLLLSALELANADDETRQLVAFRLERDGSFDRAVSLFERFAAGSSFRPQPKRDLALALAERGRQRGGGSGSGGGRADLERAFKLLSEVALDPAIHDFDGIELIALMEANALIPAIEAAGGAWELDQRLVAHLDTDVRIVIEWTADDADIDLWVDEPNGERVYYSQSLSSSGGQISNDMTDGYGPEEYAIRRAPPGKYEVRINGYDADRINPNGRGHVLIRLIRDFARARQQETLVDADLSFQSGGNRDTEDGTKPVAALRVGN